MRRSIIFFFLALVCIQTGYAACAYADEESIPLPEVIKTLQAEGAIVEFMGHELGVDGWRIRAKNGQVTFAYSTPEGGVIMGVLFRPDGRAVTPQQSNAVVRKRQKGDQAALPGAENSKTQGFKAERLYATIENKLAWVKVGDDNAPYIYTVLDPECDHCMSYWKKLHGATNAGQLQVRIIAIGHKDSAQTKAGAVLSVEDPAAALNAYVKGDEKALGAAKLRTGMKQRAKDNVEELGKWNLRASPFTMYRRPSDGELVVLMGEPKNMMLLISDLMKPAQE